MSVEGHIKSIYSFVLFLFFWSLLIPFIPLYMFAAQLASRGGRGYEGYEI